jgi:hypothetical protein
MANSGWSSMFCVDLSDFEPPGEPGGGGGSIFVFYRLDSGIGDNLVGR